MTVEHTNEIQINDKTKFVLKISYFKRYGEYQMETDDRESFYILNKCIHEIHFGDKIYNSS